MPRACDRCGARMSPHWPRKSVNGEKWCPSCVQSQGHVQTTAEVLMARYAAGWTGEDVIRHEIGRQKVHTVNGEHQLCPQHIDMRKKRADFETGLAAQVGLPRRFETPSIGPSHEGKCVDCSAVGEGKTMPWNPREVPGATLVHQDRQPTVHIDTDERLQQGRWPSRPHLPHERFAPVDISQIRSVNMRMRMAIVVRPGHPDRIRTTSKIRVQAHDSGDGETIFHCPFCGSGQVIARSDGTVECEFCSTAFTVQVQPQMPAFPQTIDGVPVDVPGMPAGGMNANVPADGPAGPDPAAEDGTDPESGPPGADGGDEGDDDSDDGGDDKPAFLKGSMLLRTARGHALDGRQYARHLALAHTANRSTVLAQIRSEGNS